MTHYFLFGSEAVGYHYNQEFENIQTCKFGLFKFTDKSTPIDLLIAYEGPKASKGFKKFMSVLS